MEQRINGEDNGETGQEDLLTGQRRERSVSVDAMIGLSVVAAGDPLTARQGVC